ncbi:cytochrome P450 [Pseudoduganella sp. DS3]|uniref:Cytochrome P450 n=1 Tax=Pseudoduganella guangdongensis TaxID=2692179 RepID=A0A6N9HDW8_9BURK|nr:cytochrome P450 [Pseudoduganella guangdongensis]MYN01748.1 cytochrome P450 [Pseudoduganella guangdongensis]
MDTTTTQHNGALRQLSDLPGPAGLPFLGNALQLRPRSVHADVEAMARRYGALFRLRVGRQQALVVADAALVGAILRDRPDGFRRPDVTAQVSDEMGGERGVFLAEGAAWRKQRKMVMQAFAPHAIKAYFPLLARVGKRLQARWEAAAREGRPIALNADLKRYTVDVVAGLALGEEVNTIEHGDDVVQQQLELIMEGTARRSLLPVPYWRYVKLPFDRRLEAAVAALRTATDGFIAKARQRMRDDPARAAHPQNMLEAMLAAADQEGSSIDHGAVVGNVSTMLLAGEDTTSSALAWLAWLLARHPQALRRAQEEVRRVAPDADAFTIEQMDQLEYIDACAHEAMRLKPPAPFIPLQANQDCVVGDVQLPKDSIVWCVLRHDSVSESKLRDAAAFDPQRWLDGGPARQLAMPFGAGPRLCPGRYLSLLEIKVAMACLLGRFDLLSVEGDSAEYHGFVMSPGALTMRLSPAAG